MKIENENLNEPQKPQLNIGAVSSSYICAECGKEHKISELVMADNGIDYSYYCRNCGDLLESNGNYYGK